MGSTHSDVIDDVTSANKNTGHSAEMWLKTDVTGTFNVACPAEHAGGLYLSLFCLQHMWNKVTTERAVGTLQLVHNESED